MAKLYVCLLADTEDNHPSYMPGWAKFGTDYDVKNVVPRFEWLNHFDELIDLFEKRRFLVTWFLRTDLCLRNKALNRFLPYLKKLKNFGIHIHTLEWDGKIWRQAIDKKSQVKIVNESIKIFTKTIGTAPRFSRMGWNAMSSEIMQELERNKIILDCTAVPGYSSSGFFGKRDNILDWKDSPRKLYNPSYGNYKKQGDMKILELPISSKEQSHIMYNDFFSRIYDYIPRRLSNAFLPTVISLANRMKIHTHSNFMISPNWNAESTFGIIDSLVKSVREGNDEILAGYFHPCDILDPKTGKMNRPYLDKINRVLDHLEDLDIDIVPCSAYDATRRARI
ncbi:MAG: hypothetical protein NDI94_03480 [Candidatus Woesearchaeota archaeon]|nr:hypothetical protein [Candidatus Woesearchaeota archaeon]